MKVVCICDAGVPEMLMQYMKKAPRCDVTLYTEKTLTDIKSLTTCERTAELRGAEACPVSAEMLEAVREAEILVTHVAPVNRAVARRRAEREDRRRAAHRHGKCQS